MRWPFRSQTDIEVESRGVMGTEEALKILRLLRFGDKSLREFVRLRRYVLAFRVHNFHVEFPAEGSMQLKLPEVKFRFLMTAKGRTLINNLAKFISRPDKEVLLRSVCFTLIEDGLVSSSQSIVDIGSWIGDNALVWASMLQEPGNVIAIDPSVENLRFTEALASENSISNIYLIDAVCSDRPNQSLSYSGDLSHAEFRIHESPGLSMSSTTIDEILARLNQFSIGLMHIDVEGFELRVLQGALKSIESSRPIVIFEHHLRDSLGLRGLVDFFQGLDYQVVMINEALLGCLPDCRNFLSVSSEKFETVSSHIEQKIFGQIKYFPAVPGPVLLPFLPD